MGTLRRFGVIGLILCPPLHPPYSRGMHQLYLWVTQGFREHADLGCVQGLG